MPEKHCASVDSLTSTQSIHAAREVNTLLPGIAKWVVPASIGVRMALKPNDFSEEARQEVYHELGRVDEVRRNFLAEQAFRDDEVEAELTSELSLSPTLAHAKDQDLKYVREFSKEIRATFPTPLSADSKKIVFLLTPFC